MQKKSESLNHLEQNQSTSDFDWQRKDGLDILKFLRTEFKPKPREG